jgi:chromosomal replication initiation ATPase DnaA
MEKAEFIIINVCEYYKVDKELVTSSRSREQFIADVRHISQYLIRYNTDLELKDIGGFFGRKHPAVIHAIKRIHSQLSNKFDDTIKNDIIKLNEKISHYEHN